ncbi:hypothetical protein N7510_008916 [Penicillium lagena]|uniref:uncharacterized protein n=1 Tax=Penicillium lagena TaxID=94218 RepID=UPI002541D79F|nr:uncharacterized protein N7510_008916 [Penicillium lagena]KAJ5606135.1 hypothetical protein N7510_008916 [Penicillium lagena]
MRQPACPKRRWGHELISATAPASAPVECSVENQDSRKNADDIGNLPCTATPVRPCPKRGVSRNGYRGESIINIRPSR